MEANTNGLWNKQQAADYLGVAVSTLNHWICDRKIVFVKMGRLVRFRKADLDRFILRSLRGKSNRAEDKGGNVGEEVGDV